MSSRLCILDNESMRLISLPNYRFLIGSLFYNTHEYSHIYIHISVLDKIGGIPTLMHAMTGHKVEGTWMAQGDFLP